MRKLYYGDNYDILRHHIDDESADLVYLDPPFKSDQNYNVLFRDHSGDLSTAQIQAFEDTWTWDMAAARSYHHTVTDGPERVSLAMQSFRTLVGESDMLAYLAMMAPRLVELHRVLKSTGTLYLHCDPTASHYLKLLLDATFGPEHFRNEIIWKRTTGKSLQSVRLPNNHDVLLVYGKTDDIKWNHEAAFIPYEEDNLPEKTAKKYRHVDSDGRVYRLDSLINPNQDRPNLTYEFLGITKVWRWTKDRMQKAYREGIVVQTNPGTVPQLKRYLDEQRGLPIGDVWGDIPPLNSQAAERLGYPTQKPEELMCRIIELSSDEGDVILDPFCGCGTTIAAAEKLNRSWIGIDITHLAITLIKHRLLDTYGEDITDKYEVLGEPTTEGGAEELAQLDRHQFEYWALGLVGARPHEEKKGADRGIDGRLFFIDDPRSAAKHVIISVKSGANVGVAMVRDLRGTVEREDAAIGVLITLHESTSAMRKEAASSGFYKSPFGNHARIQILTIEELLAGQQIDYPKQTQRLDKTFKKAKATKKRSKGSPSLFDQGD